MALERGTRLGPYEVTAPIGAGGMGEVYRARDTKLKRDVALKVLGSYGIVKLTKIQSNDSQDIVIASDQKRDTMGTSLGCLPAT